MSRSSTSAPSRAVVDDALYRSVVQGYGDWHNIPQCVRDAIAQLIPRNTSSYDNEGGAFGDENNYNSYPLQKATGNRSSAASRRPTSAGQVKTAPISSSRGRFTDVSRGLVPQCQRRQCLSDSEQPHPAHSNNNSRSVTPRGGAVTSAGRRTTTTSASAAPLSSNSQLINRNNNNKRDGIAEESPFHDRLWNWAPSPLLPLSSDTQSFLLSIRSFEDAERLRHASVKNIAIFHNNNEQILKDMKLFLVPELRAAIQLHPEVVEALRRADQKHQQHVGQYHQPNHSHAVTVSESTKREMLMLDCLLDDLVEAAQALRNASVRFAANFLTDEDKKTLGINPVLLPREDAAQFFVEREQQQQHNSPFFDAAAQQDRGRGPGGRQRASSSPPERGGAGYYDPKPSYWDDRNGGGSRSPYGSTAYPQQQPPPQRTVTDATKVLWVPSTASPAATLSAAHHAAVAPRGYASSSQQQQQPRNKGADDEEGEENESPSDRSPRRARATSAISPLSDNEHDDGAAAVDPYYEPHMTPSLDERNRNRNPTFNNTSGASGVIDDALFRSLEDDMEADEEDDRDLLQRQWGAPQQQPNDPYSGTRRPSAHNGGFDDDDMSPPSGGGRHAAHAAGGSNGRRPQPPRTRPTDLSDDAFEDPFAPTPAEIARRMMARPGDASPLPAAGGNANPLQRNFVGGPSSTQYSKPPPLNQTTTASSSTSAKKTPQSLSPAVVQSRHGTGENNSPTNSNSSGGGGRRSPPTLFYLPTQFQQPSATEKNQKSAQQAASLKNLSPNNNSNSSAARRGVGRQQDDESDRLVSDMEPLEEDYEEHDDDDDDDNLGSEVLLHTPRERNDFIVHGKPRPLQVKKKTIYVPLSPRTSNVPSPTRSASVPASTTTARHAALPPLRSSDHDGRRSQSTSRRPRSSDEEPERRSTSGQRRPSSSRRSRSERDRSEERPKRRASKSPSATARRSSSTPASAVSPRPRTERPPSVSASRSELGDAPTSGGEGSRVNRTVLVSTPRQHRDPSRERSDNASRDPSALRPRRQPTPLRADELRGDDSNRQRRQRRSTSPSSERGHNDRSSRPQQAAATARPRLRPLPASSLEPAAISPRSRRRQHF